MDGPLGTARHEERPAGSGVRRRPVFQFVKRCFDVVVAGIALLVLFVPLLLVAVLVKVTSRGPVLYRQQRVGRGGRLFWLYKFRTMRPGDSGPQVTADGDARVTPIGRLLRRSKIDELPQLWNVVRGDMSVIGPRPEVPRFVQHYTPEERCLLEQTPGLAGLSVLVYAHEPELLKGCTDPEEVYRNLLMPRKLAVDLEYERRRTFWSDLRLCGAVVLAVLGRNPRLDRRPLQQPAAAERSACE
jgi:lipopolysaccharide/colanic/teichoic acid biosynthesis glycosyltransferase